jgi:hypothetical protein
MSNWFTDATGIKIGPSKDMQGWLGINENYETMTPEMIQAKKEAEIYNSPEAQFQREMDEHTAKYKEQQTLKEKKMEDHSSYNSAVDEEMMDPGSKYNLPGYEGLVLQSYPPKIQINGEYVTLVKDGRGDWTYPNSGPEAEAFEARQDQGFFEERRRLGTLPSGFDQYGPLGSRSFDRDNAYARSPEADPASNPEAIEYYNNLRAMEAETPTISYGNPGNTRVKYTTGPTRGGVSVSPFRGTPFEGIQEDTKDIDGKKYMFGTNPSDFVSIWR